MEWLNLSVTDLSDADFRRCPLQDRGVWLTLLGFCVQQENRGRIAGVEQWCDFECIAALGVPKAALEGAHMLWKFECGDLLVSGYPQEQHNSIEAKRRAARRTNRQRWRSESLSDSPSDTASESPSDSVKERKGKEGKEKKRNTTKAGALVIAELVDERLKARLLEVNALMARRDSTPWSAKEWAAFQAMGLDRLEAEAWTAQIGPLAAYYAAPRDGWLREFWAAKPGDDFRRRDLLTLLHNWPGEVDRAVKFGDWLEQKKRRDEEGALR